MNLHGNVIFEEYPEDNYCLNNTQNLEFRSGEFGSGSLYHQIPRDDDEPYVRTRTSVISPQGGTLVWAVGHLHAGGVNTTFRINVEVVCNAVAVYGTVGGEGIWLYREPLPNSPLPNSKFWVLLSSSCPWSIPRR